MIHLNKTTKKSYSDLLNLLKDDALCAIKGKPILRDQAGKPCWYSAEHIGKTMHLSYIGPDSKELRARIDRIEELRARSMDRQNRKSRLAINLRKELLRVDHSIGNALSAMEKAGVFRLGGTLIGTIAFRLYEAHLGIKLPEESGIANTKDIDIAQFEKLSRNLNDHVNPNLLDVFKKLDFHPMIGLEIQKPWRWQKSGSELKVEFLVPAFGEKGSRYLPALGIHGQGLHFLNFLIAHPIQIVAAHKSGILLQIPAPERYAIHKLIVADRRYGGEENPKTSKDRSQAAFLIDFLSRENPDNLSHALSIAIKSGPKWGECIENSLKHLPKTKEILESLPNKDGVNQILENDLY